MIFKKKVMEETVSFNNWIFLIQGRYFVYHEGLFFEVRECSASNENRWFNQKDGKFYLALKKIEASKKEAISKIYRMFS